MKIAKVKQLPIRERFWYWIKERESIRLKKESGTDQLLWTDDEILQTYRFCNVRRMEDKVSNWLLRNWYQPYFDNNNMLAACAIARFVNKPESLKEITEAIFSVHREPNWKLIKKTLRNIKSTGQVVFNGAYMVRGNSKKSPDKIGTVIDDYVKPMVDKVKWFNADSMEQTHAEIAKHYGYGSFMAGQIVADMRWAVSGYWKDKNIWAPVGPGSARGLARYVYLPSEWSILFKRYVNRNPNEWLGDFRVYILEEAKTNLPSSITSWLEAHDYQNCLCEFDKYERALNGEGKPKQLYRSGK